MTWILYEIQISVSVKYYWNMVMLICLCIVYSCFHDTMVELRSYNRDYRAHKIFTVWIFIGEIPQLLFWTKGYIIILKVPEIYLKRCVCGVCVFRNSLEKFFDSLNDLVLKPILPGLRIRCPLSLKIISGKTISASRGGSTSWKLGWRTELLDGQQNQVLLKPQLLFRWTDLINYRPFPA